MEPSDLNNGRNDPISYTMIVLWLFSTFLAILDFFESYHALAMLCKLKDFENLSKKGFFLCHLKRVLRQKTRQKWQNPEFGHFLQALQPTPKIEKFSKSPKSCPFEPKVMRKCLKNIFKGVRMVAQILEAKKVSGLARSTLK